MIYAILLVGWILSEPLIWQLNASQLSNTFMLFLKWRKRPLVPLS
jgi:hypothetical protein